MKEKETTITDPEEKREDMKNESKTEEEDSRMTAS